jgi:phage-related protein
MDTLNSNLLILDIQHSQPDRTAKKQTVANLDGCEISDTYVGQRRVTVTFELHIYDIAKRNEACQKINAWAANGGTLITNDRSGQQLINVTCEQFADIDSAKNWTDPLTVVFATTSNPYWVSTAQKTVSITGKTASGRLTIDGNVGMARVNVAVTAVEKVTTLQLVVGSTKIKLTGLNVNAGQKVNVDYIKDRYIRILANGSSVLANLDPSVSSDQLLAGSGQNTAVSVSASGRVTAVFSARGCWL